MELIFFIAEKIAETGFATLSSLDSGYFGRGIYFSTYAMYTLPYFAMKRYPSVIISWLLPGQPYPVTEHQHGPNSIMGQAIKNNSNSHYVVTNKTGAPCEMNEHDFYDEVVVSSENQIAPAFILRIGSSNLTTLSLNWAKNQELERQQTL